MEEAICGFTFRTRHRLWRQASLVSQQADPTTKLGRPNSGRYCALVTTFILSMRDSGSTTQFGEKGADPEEQLIYHPPGVSRQSWLFKPRRKCASKIGMNSLNWNSLFRSGSSWTSGSVTAS